MNKTRMMSILLLVLLLAVSGGLVNAQAESGTPTELCAAVGTAADPATREYTQAEQVLEAGVDYRAVFCTEAGAVYIDLFEQIAPVTVNNFVFLAQNGYYNNTTFHRVLADFMVQGGDPTATGSGGPGYQFEDEFVGYVVFDQPGQLAMANAGPGTNGSQFFITTVPTPHLNLRHTIFGEVLEGQENVEAIRLRDPQTDTTPGASLQTVIIITDPDSVTTTYVKPEPASEEDVVLALNAIASVLPPDALIVEEEATGLFTTDNIISFAPEAVREQYGEFLTGNNHAYRAAHSIVNTACSLEEIGFVSIGYTLDAFASAEDASAALADGFLDTLAVADGFTAAETSGSLPGQLYTKSENACDTDVTHALTHWQRGRFVVTAEAVVPNDIAPLADRFLNEFVGLQIYEPLFASVLRPEVQ